MAVFVCPAQLILFGADGYTFLDIYIIVPLMLWWFRGDRINHLLNKIPLRPGKLYFPIYLLHFPMMLLMKSLIPSYAGENGIVGNGEDKKEKPPVVY
ncbi:MAG: hypothetical protein ACLTIG_15190 [Roseburia hominis]